MPAYIFGLPKDTIALALLGLALEGALVLKPVMRVLIGSGADLNESIGCATAGFNLF